MSVAWSRLLPMFARPWFGPLAMGILATVIVSVALDPAGDYPGGWEGPGLTVDEIFNVDVGVRIADRVLAGDVPGAIRAGRTLPDHPPLGRLWLGLFHEAVLLIAPPRSEHAALVVAAARFGSAVAFGLLVWLIGLSTAKWFGTLAGCGASATLVLMPRVFGHAHLAALETVLNLTYTLAILSVAHKWSNARAPTLRTAALCGIWLGLALLTKIQAVFIPIPIAVWALLNWRHKAILPLVVWGLVGLLVFLCGWPWLWLDPLGNVLKYLGHASQRSSIQVWYCGQAFADRNVPWHYPWVLFATTVPIGLHALGVWGVIASLSVVRQSRRDGNATAHREGEATAKREGEAPAKREGEAPAEPLSLPVPIPKQTPHTTNPGEPGPVRAGTLPPQSAPIPSAPRSPSATCLLLASILFPLVMFSLPGIAVYDGERLFLVVFPLWAIVIGKGTGACWSCLRQRLTQQSAGCLLTLFFAAQSIGLWQLAPCWLSYYNAAVGGLWGADRLGLSITYWGDSVTRELWNKAAATLPADAEISVAPVLHQFQLPAWESQCPPLRQQRLKLKEMNWSDPLPEYQLRFNRWEYLPPVRPDRQDAAYEPLIEVQRQGVVLAGLYRKRRQPESSIAPQSKPTHPAGRALPPVGIE